VGCRKKNIGVQEEKTSFFLIFFISNHVETQILGVLKWAYLNAKIYPLLVRAGDFFLYPHIALP